MPRRLPVSGERVPAALPGNRQSRAARAVATIAGGFFRPLPTGPCWNVPCFATRFRMLDRDKIVTVLTRRFPAARVGQVAAAANAIVGLDDEWEELTLVSEGSPLGGTLPCRGTCYLWASLQRDGNIKIFRKRE